MPFLLAVVKHIDAIGDAKIEDVLDDYIAFYQDRLARGLQVDRSTCPYDEKMLKDRKAVQRNMLTNPFEKFERKRFECDFDEPCAVRANERGRLGKSAETDEGRFAEVL